MCIYELIFVKIDIPISKNYLMKIKIRIRILKKKIKISFSKSKLI